MTRLQFLELEIPRLSQLYYEGNAEVSDFEFDKLVDELRSINPDHELLTKTGWGYTPSGRIKIKHEIPITGISNKFRIIDEIKSYYNNSVNDNFIITPKLDGGSVVIYYKNGKLDKAISRGNGFEGVDITHTISQLDTVPKSLDHFRDLEVIRGEIVIPEENELDIEGNIRNVAIGYSQRKYTELNELEKKWILFIPYTILNTDESPNNQLNWLFNNNFIIPNLLTLSFNELLNRLESESTKSLLTSLGYLDRSITLPIDGFVITYKDKLSDLVAWKFDSQLYETKVLDINWQMNPSGKLTPVLTISEVDIEGAKINRVTANSYNFITYHKAGIGAKINIIRSGMVIPKLINTLESSENYNIPEKCKSCNSELEIDGAHIYCKNPKCNFKINDIIDRIFNTFKPKGMSYSILGEFEDFILHNKFTLIDLIRELSETKNIHINNVLTTNQLSEVRKTLFTGFINNLGNWEPKLDWLIDFANVPALGEVGINEVCKYIISNNNSIKLYDKSIEVFSNIGNHINNININQLAKKNLVDYSFKIIIILDLFKLYMNNSINKDIDYVEYVDEIIENDLPKICLTNLGGSPLKKSEIDEKLKHKYQFVDYVDNSVSKVVYCKSGSSKMNKAKELGIECIDVVTFLSNEKVI